MTLGLLRKLMADAGATRIVAKVLAENDNSKNQIYLGPDFSALNVLPTGGVRRDSDNPKILKASLKFFWISETGGLSAAPNAQLILYPQYPEVRMSGFLKGSVAAPSELMTARQAGRVLFLGICSDGRILAMVTGHGSELAREFAHLSGLIELGVFRELPLPIDSRVLLLKELHRIHLLGWIESKRLLSDGTETSCTASQCGGYTLEAELGIRPNGVSDPDYMGWEVKQHAVGDFSRPQGAKAITLMTPEPTGGFYKTSGVDAFVRKFGYKDKARSDRLNFGGRHLVGQTNPSTGLTLRIAGFDEKRGAIKDASGGLCLLTSAGAEAASWSFAALMSIWNRKHARAVYVPSMKRTIPGLKYRFGPVVRTGEGTDFILLLVALAGGLVYYDPGVKIERASSSKPEIKRRSQFRMASKQLGALYRSFGTAKLI